MSTNSLSLEDNIQSIIIIIHGRTCHLPDHHFFCRQLYVIVDDYNEKHPGDVRVRHVEGITVEHEARLDGNHGNLADSISRTWRK
jgi:hypothetical protein